ncbi:hypothetical protein GOBAR_AA10626 [Gossypium barbadense]|uniref:DUF659 domain-containing protein n=1 Tax=Gossypium barbadense TaxID=3634 RepID=A0A2P5Y3A6_GOSBA|nr:hypothetical protein GOBAR_AA10626 [Gossypium barbadense]
MAYQSGSGSVDSSNNITNASVYVTKLPKTIEGVTLQHLVEMQKIVEDAKLNFSQTLTSSFGPNTASLQRHSLGSKRRKGTLEQSFNLAAQENLDSEIDRMFYSCGLPFHLARNPHYVNAFTLASKNSIPIYIHSGLLQSIKGMWREKGISLICNGWTDAQRRPLINFMAISEGGVVFLKAYNDKFYVETLIKDTISEVGAQNVVQVITDNALVCKVAGSLVETQHPHIFWTHCVVHTLNLTLKNICAAKNIEKNEVTYDVLCWINNVGDDAIFIRNFILNHSMRLAIFNSSVPLKLLAVADTRFASMIVMISQYMVISDVSKAYLIWDEMIEKVKTSIYRHEGKKGDERSIFYEVVYDILIDRWTKSSTPPHCMAHSLNPSDWLNEIPNRLPPHKVVKISKERNKCSRRYFPSTEERKMWTWTRYSFIHSMRRNKINPQRAKDLVFVHTNLPLLSRKTLHYKEGENKILSLDEPDMKMVIFANEEDMENVNAMN